MRSAQGDERAQLLARTKELAAQVKAAEAAATEAEQALRRPHMAISNVVEEGAPAGGEDDYVVLREVGDRPEIGEPRDHLELGELLRRHRHRTRRQGVRQPVLLPDRRRARCCSSACCSWRIQQAVEYGFIPMITPVLVKPESMEGTGFLGAHASRGVPPRGRRPVPGRHVRGAAGGVPRQRDPRPARPGQPLPVRGLVVVLPPGGRLVRQGRARHRPGAPVRQGGDVLLLPAGGGARGAPAAARLAGGDARQGGGALPRHRRRRRRPRVQRRPQVRLRGAGFRRRAGTAS